MLQTLSRSTLLASLLAVGVATLAPAQQGGQQRARDGHSDHQRQQQQQDRQREQHSQRGQSDRGMRLQPQGWVTIGIDRDDDQRFESVETIYYFDLVEARKRSAQRQQDQRQQRGYRDQRDFGQRQPRSQQRMDQGRQQRSGPQQGQLMRRLSGDITKLKEVRLNDGQRHLLANIETERSRRNPIDLGRVENLRQLDLQEGDRVKVVATTARINDRRILSAREVHSGGERVRLGREQDRGVKRVQGEIVSMRTSRLRDVQPPIKIAEVELRGGRTETAILGPEDRLRKLDLQQGDQVKLLVRRGTLNDKQALVVEQIHANDQRVQVQKPQGRSFQKRQQGRSQSGN